MLRSWPAVVLAIVILASVAAAASADLAVGDKAPDFQLKKLDGTAFKLSDYTTKPTILVFWVSWCPHCQREMPLVQKLFANQKSKKFNTVGVSADDKLDNAKSFVKKYDITFPNAFAGTDDGEKVLSTYHIVGVPTLYFIDKTGTITAQHIGEMAEKEIKEELTKLGIK